MVNAGSQQQAIFSVQSFFIGGIPPRFAMAGQQMTQTFNSRDSTVRFDLHHALLEKTLTPPCSDDCFSICFIYRFIPLALFFEPSFPNVETIARHNPIIFNNSISRSARKQKLGLFSDQAAQDLSEILRKFRQID